MKKTKSKRLIIILIFLILLSIGAVNAADNATHDKAISVTNQQSLSDGEVGTFTELQAEIDDAIANNRNLTLQKDYKFSEGDNPNGITINGKITIIGNNKTIDGNSQSRIFNLDKPEIVLDNITFVNAANRAVYVTSEASYCLVNNSHFYNNIVSLDDNPGGAVFWNGTHGTISNSDFDGNKVTHTGDDHDNAGGAIFWNADYGTVQYCSFTNNLAYNGGGAIAWGRPKDDEHPHPYNQPIEGIISDCIFINNSVFDQGGAIELCGDGGVIKHSIFQNNTAEETSAIKLQGLNSEIYDCNFTFNHALDFDGVVEMIDDYQKLHDCNFANNSAQGPTGAVCWRGNNGNLTNCNFTNNTAGYYAGALEWIGNDGIIQNSNFAFNNANGDATYGGAAYISGENVIISHCDFKNNTATYCGGAVYWIGDNGNVIDSNFSLNKVLDENYGCGGAIAFGDEFFGYYTNNCNVTNSHFTNNDAGYLGGAIFWNGLTGNLKNSDFKENTAFGDDSYGGAVYSECDDLTISDYCNFTQNSALYGGAISSNADNLNINNHCNFTDNHAYETGGAIHITYSNAIIDDATFINNTADEGGAIYMESDSGTVSHCVFTDNNATNGGAISWSGANGVISDSDFTNNSVTAGNGNKALGGAIYNTGENLNITDSSFDSNKAKAAGAIYTDNKIYVDNSTFESNYVEGDDEYNYYAGAIYIVGGQNSVIKNSTFDSNHAHWGGAIWDEGYNTLLYNSTFDSNDAADYGAIYSFGDDFKVFNCSFNSNRAPTGIAAAIGIDGNDAFIANSSFINNDALDNGGGISTFGESTGIYNCTFKLNEANNGAAVYSSGDGLFVFNSTFESNSAFWVGGAILAENSETTISNCTFTNNGILGAEGWGGAISVDGDDLIISNCTFTNNYAFSDEYPLDIQGGSGGAISLDSHNFEISNCNFTNNTVSFQGGAIFLWSDDVEELNGIIFNCDFESNKAYR